jgi:hypothetical protein
VARIIEVDGDGIPDLSPQTSRARFHRWNLAHPGTHAERARAYRREKTKGTKVAVLDLETDPFDPVNRSPVFPFLAILYSDHFQPIIRWNENWRDLIAEIKSDIEALPDRFII